MRGRRWALLGLVLTLVLGLAGCTRTSGSDGGAGAGPASAPAVADRGQEPGGATPVWEQRVNFVGGVGTPQNPALVRLYPLQRISGHVLLTLDLTMQTPAGTTSFFDSLCQGESCRDLSGVSLIDTVGLHRFGPLHAGGDGGVVMTSGIIGTGMRAGLTYRFGAAFADPGTDRVAVDLQQGGVALGVPIVSGQQPAANLISTRPPGPSRPAPVAVGDLVTSPIPALVGGFGENRHDLVTRVVGGAVNQTPGAVTLNSDVLFAFDSAKPSRGASALLSRAAKVLLQLADPRQPVNVAGFTDAKGDTAYNLRLSQQRALSVARALAPRLPGFTLRPSGRGENDPVAANTTSAGADDPAGRALNRRVEISYAAKAAIAAAATAIPSPIAAPAAAASSSAAAPAPAASAAAPAAPGLGPVTVRYRGGDEVFTTGPISVRVDGNLTLVSFELASQSQAIPIGAFASGVGVQTNIGAFHLIERATKQVFVPARDQDDPGRIAGVFTHRFDAGIPYHYTFFTAALPARLGTVDVALASLGTAARIPVTQ